MTSALPARTLAVVLGASTFPNAPKLAEGRAFYISAADVADYLRGNDGMGLPRRNVLSLFDDSHSPSDQLIELATFLHRRNLELKSEGNSAEDLIIYYVGHGLFARGDQAYCLAVRCTNEINHGATSIRAADLASVIKENAAFLRRYLILDCCFSASIHKEFQSGALTTARMQIDAEFPKRGTALLCSSSAHNLSLAPPGLEHTMFSDALLAALRKGHPAAGRRLSFGELSDIVKENLRTKYPDTWVRPEVHSPDQREGDIASILLFPNPAYARREAEERKAHEIEEAKRIVDERATAEQKAALEAVALKKAQEEQVARERSEKERLTREAAEAKRIANERTVAEQKAALEAVARKKAQEEQVARERAEQVLLTREREATANKAKQEGETWSERPTQHIGEEEPPATRAPVVDQVTLSHPRKYALTAFSVLLILGTAWIGFRIYSGLHLGNELAVSSGPTTQGGNSGGKKTLESRAQVPPAQQSVSAPSPSGPQQSSDVPWAELLSAGMLDVPRKYRDGIAKEPTQYEPVVTARPLFSQLAALTGISGDVFSARRHDGSIIVGDLTHGTEVRRISATCFIYDCASILSRDGKRVAVAYDTGIDVWDVTSGTRVAHTDQTSGYWYDAAFSPDSQKLAFGRADGVLVWNFPDGRVTRVPAFDSVSISWSLNGRYIASTGGDLSNGYIATVRLWDVKQRVARTFSSGSETVAFSDDSVLLASGGEDKKVTIRLADSGRVLQVLQGFQGKIRSVRFSPDGTLLAVGAWKELRIYRTKDWSLLQTISRPKIAGSVGTAVDHIYFSSDGFWLVFEDWVAFQSKTKEQAVVYQREQRGDPVAKSGESQSSRLGCALNSG